MARAPQAFAFTPPGTFTTAPELFQQVLKQQPSYWVAVLPQDYSKPAGVYPFPDGGQATRFAARQMDEGATCFCFNGVYIPLTLPLFPRSMGEDPEVTPLTELIGGRMLDEEMMAGFRKMHQAQQEAALAALDAPVEESEVAAVSESGESEAPADAAAPENAVVVPTVFPEAPDDDTDDDDSEAEIDDFDDLPEG